VNSFIPAGVKRRKLPKEVMVTYRGPFAKRASREPTHIFPREILRGHDYLAAAERGIEKLKDLPVLILWGDPAFREVERGRF
jgi:haloalkane dehalogenase